MLTLNASVLYVSSLPRSKYPIKIIGKCMIEREDIIIYIGLMETFNYMYPAHFYLIITWGSF